MPLLRHYFISCYTCHFCSSQGSQLGKTVNDACSPSSLHRISWYHKASQQGGHDHSSRYNGPTNPKVSATISLCALEFRWSGTPSSVLWGCPIIRVLVQIVNKINGNFPAMSLETVQIVCYRHVLIFIHKPSFYSGDRLQILFKEDLQLTWSTFYPPDWLEMGTPPSQSQRNTVENRAFSSVLELSKKIIIWINGVTRDYGERQVGCSLCDHMRQSLEPEF